MKARTICRPRLFLSVKSASLGQQVKVPELFNSMPARLFAIVLLLHRRPESRRIERFHSGGDSSLVVFIVFQANVFVAFFFSRISLLSLQLVCVPLSAFAHADGSKIHSFRCNCMLHSDSSHAVAAASSVSFEEFYHKKVVP